MSEPTTRTEEYLDAIAKAAARIADALDRMTPRPVDATAPVEWRDPDPRMVAGTAEAMRDPGVWEFQRKMLPDGLDAWIAQVGLFATMPAAEAGQAAQDAASPSGGSVERSGGVLDENDHRDRLLSDGVRLTRYGYRNWRSGWGPVGRSLDSWAEVAAPLTFAPESDA